jgi:hypothetical protein
MAINKDVFLREGERTASPCPYRCAEMMRKIPVTSGISYFRRFSFIFEQQLTTTTAATTTNVLSSFAFRKKCDIVRGRSSSTYHMGVDSGQACTGRPTLFAGVDPEIYETLNINNNTIMAFQNRKEIFFFLVLSSEATDGQNRKCPNR